MPLATTSIDTPIGRYALLASEHGLVQLEPADAAPAADAVPARSPAERMLERARAAFACYFAGDAGPLAALPLGRSGRVVERSRGRAALGGAGAQPQQCRGLDLTHALARESESVADLTQRRRLVFAGEAEAPVDHLALARRQRLEELGERG